MTPGVVTFYWGVQGKVAGIGHHTIFLPPDARAAFHDLSRGKRIPPGLPFYISIPSETDPSFAPAGDSSVFALVPVPVLSDMPDLDWPAALADMKSKILARLNLPADRIIVEEIWTPAEWRDRFALYDGSAFGAAHTLFQMGPFRTRNFSAATKGLYYTGGSTTPGTGMPMVVLGGKMTADRIAAHAH
jgi:phytoene desaturase